MTQQDGNKTRASAARQKWEARRSEILEMYVTHGMSQGEVAERQGCSQALVCKLLKQWGIKAHPKANSGARNGRYVDGSQSRLYRSAVTKEKCNRCSSTESLCIHHVNDDHYDNRPENLEVLCVGCHLSHHKTQYWDAWRRGEKTPKSTGRVGWVKR